MIDGRCGARRRDGKPCTQFPIKGKARCKMHGGKSTGAKKPHKTHGAYELVAKHQRHPKPRPDAVSKMTESEQLRLSNLRELTDLQIVHEQLRICVIALERTPLDATDVRTKINGSINQYAMTGARLRGDPINLNPGKGVPKTPVTQLTDAQLMAIAATALELHAAGEPA